MAYTVLPKKLWHPFQKRTNWSRKNELARKMTLLRMKIIRKRKWQISKAKTFCRVNFSLLRSDSAWVENWEEPDWEGGGERRSIFEETNGRDSIWRFSCFNLVTLLTLARQIEQSLFPEIAEQNPEKPEWSRNLNNITEKCRISKS